MKLLSLAILLLVACERDDNRPRARNGYPCACENWGDKEYDLICRPSDGIADPQPDGGWYVHPDLCVNPESEYFIPNCCVWYPDGR